MSGLRLLVMLILVRARASPCDVVHSLRNLLYASLVLALSLAVRAPLLEIYANLTATIKLRRHLFPDS